MTLSDTRDFCLALPHTTESTPFGPDVLVFKVADKLFALASLTDVPPRLNLKCDPDRALDLRDQYDAIQPGYHMNKRHWNTIHIEGIPTPLLRDLILHSYHLVTAALPAAPAPPSASTDAPPISHRALDFNRAGPHAWT
jgi:predicted DNA-binding protein (MmcQ/YjbR family)